MTEALDEILFTETGGVGAVLLNRPRAMNALTLDKIRRLDPMLRSWARNPSIRLVTIEGAGDRAFCAGGDIRALRDAVQDRNNSFPETFFAEEYRLNHLIKTFPKPFVALMDGITMGGGVGVSVHGSHRVATERTVFAMPETGIGMLPDVGGTWFLPRCPGALGLYLGLTGARLKAADCLAAGICTHVVPSERLPALKAALVAEAPAESAAVTAILDRFHTDPGAAPLAAHRAVIDRCFGHETLDGILDALADEGSDWAIEARQVILTKSPLATRVAHRQLTAGAALDDFATCMALEYRIAPRLVRQPDFAEGVRAVILDKDNAPRWSPESLEAVDLRSLDALFARPEGGDLTFSDDPGGKEAGPVEPAGSAVS